MSDQLTLFEEYDSFIAKKKEIGGFLELLSKCGAKVKPNQGSFQAKTGKKTFSRRANHQYKLVVLIVELNDETN